MRVETEGVEVAPELLDGGTFRHLHATQTLVGEESARKYHHRVWSVHDARGLEEASQVSIVFDPAYEELVLHELRLHRAGEALDVLEPERWKLLQRETALEARLYDERLTALAFLEDVRVGDAVELEYTLSGSDPALGGRFVGSLQLGFPHHVERVRHRLLWPAGRRLHHRAYGSELEPRVTRAGERTEYVWDLRDVERIDPPWSAPVWYQPFPWVQLSEFPDWAAVVEWALPLYATPDAPSPELRAEIDAIAERTDDPEERTLAALRFVRDDVRYLGLEIGAGGLAPSAPRVVLARRYGDCKDKVRLLGTMLRELGIEAHPAFVSTVLQRTVVRYLPSPWIFDHVVVAARPWGGAGGVSWLDPTDAWARGRLGVRAPPPYRRALVVQEGETRLARLPMGGRRDPTLDVEVTFDGLGEDETPAMEVETVYSRRRADAVRATIAPAERDALTRRYVEYYRTFYPSIEARDELVVEDDQERNRIRIVERYAIPKLWTLDEERGLDVAEFFPFEVRDALPVVSGDPERSAPLAVPHPRHLRWALRADLGEGWDIDAERTRVENRALRYESSVSHANGTLFLDYEYESKRDSVPAKEGNALGEDLVRIEADLGLMVWRGDEVEPWTLVLGGAFALVVLAGAVGALVLVSRRIRARPLSEARSARPALAVWTHPRLAVRRAIERPGERDVFVLAALAGIVFLWDRASGRNLGERFGFAAILGGGLVLGPVVGTFQVLVGATILRLAGRLLRGRGSVRALCKAIAYANVPNVAAGLLWIPQLLAIGEEMFTLEMPGVDRSLALSALLFGTGTLQLVLAVWSVVLLCVTVAEAHEISVGRSVAMLVTVFAGIALVAGTCVGALAAAP